MTKNTLSRIDTVYMSLVGSTVNITISLQLCLKSTSCMCDRHN